MGINIFINLLLVLTIGAYFLPIDKKIKYENNKDMPLVVFDKPLMFTIDEKNINRVVKANHAVRYKDRDEMQNAKIILRNKKQKDNYELENLEALKIIKKNDLLILKDSVQYKRDDFMKFNTQELFYELKTKVAYNNSLFTGNYNEHFLRGKNLFFDSVAKELKSENIHFEIEIKDKEGKK